MLWFEFLNRNRIIYQSKFILNSDAGKHFCDKHLKANMSAVIVNVILLKEYENEAIIRNKVVRVSMTQSFKSILDQIHKVNYSELKELMIN